MKTYTRVMIDQLHVPPRVAMLRPPFDHVRQQCIPFALRQAVILRYASPLFVSAKPAKEGVNPYPYNLHIH